MELTAAAVLSFAVLILPIVGVVALVVWVVRTTTRSREAAAAATAASNHLIVDHLRGVSERLERIERQLGEIPE